MDYDIEIVQMKPVVIAAVRSQFNAETLGEAIIASLDTVYAFLATAAIEQRGLNVAVYLDSGDIEVGVQVSARFEPAGNVRCSTTPAGKAAHVIHHGAYALLSQAHDTARQWCAVNGIELTGTNWEVYGHWHDDPQKLRTDVFYLLTDS